MEVVELLSTGHLPATSLANGGVDGEDGAQKKRREDMAEVVGSAKGFILVIRRLMAKELPSLEVFTNEKNFKKN